MRRGSREEHSEIVYFTEGDYAALHRVTGEWHEVRARVGQLEEDLERMRVSLLDHRRAERDEAEAECQVAQVVEVCDDMVAAWERYDAKYWPSYDARQNMLKTSRDAARMVSVARAVAQAEG